MECFELEVKHSFWRYSHFDVLHDADVEILAANDTLDIFFVGVEMFAKDERAAVAEEGTKFCVLSAHRWWWWLGYIFHPPLPSKGVGNV